MKLLSLFRPAPPVEFDQPTANQRNVQARAIRYLAEHGHIDARTVQRLGTTSPHKLLYRLRRKGLLYEVGDPKGFVMVPGKHGSSYKLYYATRKVPACPPRGGARA